MEQRLEDSCQTQGSSDHAGSQLSKRQIKVSRRHSVNDKGMGRDQRTLKEEEF